MFIHEAIKQALTTGKYISRERMNKHGIKIEPTDTPECCRLFTDNKSPAPRWQPQAEDTNMCSVLSANGKLIIEDSLITMKDAKDVTRFECGYSGGKYIFCLYNAKGDRTVYINDDGEAVFAGVIATRKNIEVGTNLVVGKNSASGRIDFAGMINQAEGSIEVVDHEMRIVADYVLINGVDILQELRNIKNNSE